MMVATFFFIFILFAMCLSFGHGGITDATADLLSSRSVSSGAAYIPIIYKVQPRVPECLYDNFEKSDFVTFSVFVTEALNNGAPTATITFEGPVAGNADVLKKVEQKAKQAPTLGDSDSDSGKPSLGRELRRGQVTHWPMVKDSDNVRYDQRIGLINRSVKVDWSHAGDTEDAVASREQIQKEKREAYRNYGRGPSRASGDLETVHEKYNVVTQNEIAPFQETNAIKAPGWYRLCVAASHQPLMVEMEMRSGTRLGGVDRKTNHVYTHREKEYLDAERTLESEEEKLDANTYASLEEEKQKELANQVRERDLHASQAQIKHLNIMVKEMSQQHSNSYYRVRSHTASARKNHESLLWNSKLQTLLYVAITGVQIYTLRKWLLNNSLQLGK